MNNTVSSRNLYAKLKNLYDIICFEDLGILSGSKELVYKLFDQHHRPVFNHNQRIVLYSRDPIPEILINHVLKAAGLVDISINFILLVSPNVDEILENFKINHPSEGNCFELLEHTVSDATPLADKTKYHVPDTICPYPWMSTAISGDGYMTPCCVYFDKVVTDNDQSQQYNINHHDFDQYYHSQHMTELRQSLLRGEKPAGCNKCWTDEKYGNKSCRQHLLTYYAKEFASLSNDETTDHIINLDLDLGNLCNLKCRICNWKRSSLIASEVLTKGNKFVDAPREEIKKFNKNAKWFDNPDVIHKFDKIFPNLQNFESEGGEPFLYDYYKQIYQKFIDNKRAQSVRIRHSSNATIFPAHDLWPYFKEVQLCLSIDDIGPRFEYQRDGESWETVKSVLTQYQNLDYDNLKLAFWVTINIQNIYYLPELIDELYPYGWEIHFGLLKGTSQLNLKNLTQKAKAEILKKFDQYKKYHLEKSKLIDLAYRLVADVIPTDGKNFWEYINYHDQLRSKYYHESHPEMAKLMGKV